MTDPTGNPHRTAANVGDRTLDAAASDVTAAPADGRTLDQPVADTRVGPDDDQRFVLGPLSAGQTGEFKTGEFRTEVQSSSGTQQFDVAQAVRQARKLENVKVPGYQILAELGHGGMGVVYKARQVALDRLVALKMVLAGIHASNTQLARFVQEAKAVAHVQHPNIVQIYDISEADGVPYFSLEFVDGGSLEQAADHKPQPPAYAANMVETLARAMQFAHDQNIIHRDLKPANVLLTKAGVPKIADFGLAKKLDDASQTQAGQVMGTPSYMSPEQASGVVSAVGPASDQYALGAMLYELLTGRPPFSGASVMETLHQVRTREPVPPSQLNPATPRDLETICLKALQKDPEKRYPSCGELAADLRRYQAGEPIVARPVGSLERTWRWAKRNPVVAGLGAVAAGLLVVAAGVAAAFAVHFRNAARTEHNLRVESEQRYEANRQLTDVIANEIPEWVQDAIYTPEIQGLIQDRIVQLREQQAARSDDRHLQLRAEQALLMRRAAVAAHGRRFDEAVALTERARRLALEVLNDSPREKDKSAGNLAATLAQQASIHLLKRDYDRAQALLEESLAIRRRLVEAPESGELTLAERQTALAAILARIGEARMNSGDLPGAIRYCEEAQAVYAAVPPAEMRPIDWQSMGASLRILGDARFKSGDLAGGRADADRAIAVLTALVDDQPQRLFYQRFLAFQANGLGELELLHPNGDPSRAASFFDLALGLRARLASAPEIEKVRREQADAHYAVATAALRLRQRATADTHYRACLDLRQAIVNANPRDTNAKLQLMLAQARCGLHAEATALADRAEKAARSQIKDPAEQIRFLKMACWAFGLSAAALDPAVTKSLPPNAATLRQTYLDRAFAILDHMVTLGYRDAAELQTDPDFDPLRADERYSKTLATLRSK